MKAVFKIKARSAELKGKESSTLIAIGTPYIENFTSKIKPSKTIKYFYNQCIFFYLT
jgi:hypothetical protein